jgi:hypothetical protein
MQHTQPVTVSSNGSNVVYTSTDLLIDDHLLSSEVAEMLA